MEKLIFKTGSKCLQLSVNVILYSSIIMGTGLAHASNNLACVGSNPTCGQETQETKPCSAEGASCNCNLWNSTCTSATSRSQKWYISSGCSNSSQENGAFTCGPN